MLPCETTFGTSAPVRNQQNPPHRGFFAHELRNQTGGHLPCGCILVFVTRLWQSRDIRVTKITGAVMMNFTIFCWKNCEIHHDSSCYFRDACVQILGHSCHEKNRSHCHEFHGFFREKNVKFIITAPVIFMSRLWHDRDRVSVTAEIFDRPVRKLFQLKRRSYS